MDTGPGVPVKPKRWMTFGRFALILLLPLLVLFSIIEFVFKAENFTPETAGDATSHAVWFWLMILIPVGTLRLVQRLWRDASPWPFWVGAFVVALTLPNSLLSAYQAVSEDAATYKKQALTDLSDARRTIDDAQVGIDRDGVSVADAEKVASSPGSKAADMREVARIIRASIDRSVDSQTSYRKELDRISWLNILDPARLAKDTDFTEADSMIRQARKAYTAFQAELNAIPDQLRQDALNTQMSKSFKTGFLSELEPALVIIKKRNDYFLELHRRMIDEAAAVIATLKTTPGFGVEGSNLLFNRQADLEKFNAGLSRVITTWEELQQLAKESSDRTRDELSRMSEEVGRQ